MRERFKQFTENVRVAEEPVKRFWTFVFSAGAMVVVVALWVVYNFLFTVHPTPVVAEAESTNNEGRVQIATVSESIQGALDDVRRAAGTRYNVLIDAEDRNLIYDELEPISPTTLP